MFSVPHRHGLGYAMSRDLRAPQQNGLYATKIKKVYFNICHWSGLRGNLNLKPWFSQEDIGIPADFPLNQARATGSTEVATREVQESAIINPFCCLGSGKTTKIPNLAPPHEVRLKSLSSQSFGLHQRRHPAGLSRVVPPLSQWYRKAKGIDVWNAFVLYVNHTGEKVKRNKSSGERSSHTCIG